MPCPPDSRGRRRGLSAVAAILSLLVVPVSAAHARTWYVKANGTGDAPTIQAAVDSAAVGDVLLIAAGHYTWANQGGGNGYGMVFVPRGKDRLTIRGESGAASTVLDAQMMGRVLFIQGFNNCIVEGLTFTGGQAPATGNYVGGGLATHLSGDIVRDCVFVNNYALQGGGLWCGGVSTLTVERCEFRYNYATNGGALFFINSNTTQTVRDCVLTKNVASATGGAIYGVNDGLDLQNTVVTENSAQGGDGGAIYLRSMWPSTVTGCTFVSNDGSGNGGIFALDCPAVTIRRSIIAFQFGSALGSGSGSVISLGCNDVFGNTGGNAFPAGSADLGGNFSLDPKFCGGPGTGDFTLNGQSPCADGNHPSQVPCGVIGALGVNCGSVATERTTWGSVKARYAY